MGVSAKEYVEKVIEKVKAKIQGKGICTGSRGSFN